MRAARTVLFLALALLIACPLLAAEGGRKKGEGRRGPGGPGGSGSGMMMQRMLEGLDLTADQKAKVEEIQKEFQGKFDDARKKMEAIPTPEQKEAREAAMKKAKDAGKEGRELYEAARDAVKYTDEQKAKRDELTKQQGELYQQVREKIMSVLTDAQKETLKKRFEGRKRGDRKEEKK